MNPLVPVPRVDLVDAHVHVLDLSKFTYQWLDTRELPCRRYSFEDYHDQVPELLSAVLVQAHEHPDETNYLLELASRESGRIAGVVGYCDLERRSTANQLQTWLTNEKFLGVRFHAERTGALERSSLRRNVQLLRKENRALQVMLPTTAEPVLSLEPDLHVVVDHFGCVELQYRSADAVLGSLERLARFPNTFLKTSRPDARTEVPHRWLRAACDLFAPDRLVFGSNWPLCPQPRAEALRADQLLGNDSARAVAAFERAFHI